MADNNAPETHEDVLESDVVKAAMKRLEESPVADTEDSEASEGQDEGLPSIEEMEQAFKLQADILSKVIDTMSQKELRRVFKKLVYHPIETDHIKLSGKKEEKAAYELAQNVQQIKYNIFIQSLAQMHDDMYEDMKDKIVPEEEV